MQGRHLRTSDYHTQMDGTALCPLRRLRVPTSIHRFCSLLTSLRTASSGNVGCVPGGVGGTALPVLLTHFGHPGHASLDRQSDTDWSTAKWRLHRGNSRRHTAGQHSHGSSSPATSYFSCYPPPHASSWLAGKAYTQSSRGWVP